MNAIVPLNVTALRVNSNDNSQIVSQFKGRMGAFDNMPWGSSASQPSTGDAIVQPLESASTPANPLGVGAHAHWQLPDYFRRGVQPPTGGNVVFPQAPNRWLVERYLSVWNTQTNTYGAPMTKAFLVESDYIGMSPWTDAYGVMRPTTSVPLPVNPGSGQPYRYMGRVLNYEDWQPGSEDPNQYLPAFNGEDGKPLYLTATGFVGPGFSDYYPDCCSVFGFWDHFKDNNQIYRAITTNTPIQFKVSYQVVGWINSNATDPMSSVAAAVITQYNNYVQECAAQRVEPTETPIDFFVNLTTQQFRWTFNTTDISWTTNDDGTIKTLTAPSGTIVAGWMQEVVWNMLSSTGTTYFLSNPGNTNNPSIWTDTVEMAVGNTMNEALSVLLKHDMNNGDTDPNVLKNYEYLLDALQCGLLNDLEKQPSRMIYLDESLHSEAFAKSYAGWTWTVEQPQAQSGKAPNANLQVTLPLDLAEQLAVLNAAQKAYDQARLGLDQRRKQLFMDWLRYVRAYVNSLTGGPADPNVSLPTLTNFMETSNSGELNAVIAAGNDAGMQVYVTDPTTGQVTGLKPSTTQTSLAGRVFTAYTAVITTLQKESTNWKLLAMPSPSFYLPTDPVLLLEGDRIMPARRNGTADNLYVRLSPDLLSTLSLIYGGATFTVNTSSLSGLPAVSPVTPNQADVQTLLAEAYLLMPMFSGAVGSSLAGQGGSGNPAVLNLSGFLTSLITAQGGQSPLDGGPGAGLYALTQADNYVPAANSSQPVTTPMEITFTFTNAANNGWLPNAVAWNAQTAVPAFSSTRMDPFLPAFLIWTVRLFPMRWKGTGMNYTSDNLTGFFGLDADAVDYMYTMNGGTPVNFTASQYVEYTSSVVLSTKSTYSLTGQIDAYLSKYPSDPADPTLKQIEDTYGKRNFLAQSISGFSTQQTLRAYIAQIPVENLMVGKRDTVTWDLNQAAGATSSDNWYDYSFNSVEPIATGPIAEYNFGPLRSGFMEVRYVEIVDVFGQRMQVSTQNVLSDGSMQALPAMTLAPAAGDTVNKDMIYLPPRLLVPSRLWFRWLSATHNTDVSGITTDFVEMNTHPATSPVCGWVVPNHLDASLFFYDADGNAIGSFGLEHGVATYRTRAAHFANPTDSLEQDIGPQDEPTVNPQLANFMWWINGGGAGQLTDLMVTIQDSDMFINPDNYAQNASLAVLIGRPLALTRSVVTMETPGGLLPLSQADVVKTDPFPSDVNADRFDYTARQATSSANLGGVNFPVRMGDLANIDDGLVGYLIEAAGAQPYTTFYSAAAPAEGDNHVTQPAADTLMTTPNAPAEVLTMLVDPRAPVHATTGVLPVATLEIPPDQYTTGLNNLAVTFFTTPILNEKSGLVVPLPAESGFAWNWITPGASAAEPLAANAANGNAVWSYTPQTVLEGWLDLVPAPAPKGKK
jgi:hypothetical protein